MALLLGGTGKSLWRASARSFCCSSFTRGHKLIKRRVFSLKEKVQLHYSEGVTKKVEMGCTPESDTPLMPNTAQRGANKGLHRRRE